MVGRQNAATLELTPPLAALLIGSGPSILFLAGGADFAWDYVSPQFTAYTGAPSEAALGLAWQSWLHPEDRLLLDDGFRHARLIGEGLRGSLRLRNAAGTYCWFDYQIGPAPGTAAGAPWAGSLTLAQERHDAADRQARLLVELRRRAAGVLALIRSMTSRTLEASGDAEHFAAHLSGRIGALGRVQLLLSRRGDAFAPLEEIVREELLAQDPRGGATIEVQGPEVLLGDAAAASLGLALHELATNAVKFGALADPEGRLSVTWSVDTATLPPRLALCWQESGGAAPEGAALPQHYGFGREMIEQGLPYELDAVTGITLTASGLRCDIVFPLVAPRPDTILEALENAVRGPGGDKS